jgi:hypothetical protein
MSLVADRATPGLWVDPSRKRGTSGTFAVVIGISEYAHLAGGPGPLATNTYGLGQLSVSALTAFSFFSWLSDTYRCTHAPLAQCWLLLAPTAEELKVVPTLRAHQLLPTFQNCSNALRTWIQSLRLLAQYSRQSAEASRAVFFFSGHGIEVVLDKQLLCPSDYLEPPDGSVNEAISTSNLWLSLGTVPVGEQVLLYDACRNDTDELRAMNRLEGSEILNVSLNDWYADRSAIKATATGPGANAWQPGNATADDSKSVFGTALLEALRAEGGIELDCGGDPCCLRSGPLEAYLRLRVPQLLVSLATSGSPPPRQPVRFLAENAVAMSITEIQRGGAAVPAIPPPPLPGQPSPVPSGTPERLIIQLGDAMHDSIYQSRRVLTPPWSPNRAVAYAADFGTAHEIFGSEDVTALWIGQSAGLQGVRLYSYDQSQWVGGAEELELHYVEHNGDASMQNIVFSTTRTGQCWLELTDPIGQKFGVVLPGDLGVSTRYLLKVNLGRAETGGRSIASIEASLARDNAGLLGNAYRLWERYRTVSALDAAQSADMTVLEEVLRAKLESPLAATIAAIVLLRAGRDDLLHDWLQNLSNWFPNNPDGPVLEAERLIRQARRGASVLRAAHWIKLLTNRGLPRTAETISFLTTQLELLLDRRDIGDDRLSLEQVQSGLQNALRYLRSSGLFAIYAGKDVNPEITRFNQNSAETSSPTLKRLNR